MTKVLVAPNGLVIQGTLERVHGVGLIQSPRVDGEGTFDFDWAGETDVWWEGQQTVETDKGERLFVDEQGNEWPESQLELVDESELEAGTYA